MNERVQEAVDIMLEDVLSMKRQDEMLEWGDAMAFAYQHLLAMHQWRLQLTGDELDESWEQLRDRVQAAARELQQ